VVVGRESQDSRSDDIHRGDHAAEQQCPVPEMVHLPPRCLHARQPLGPVPIQDPGPKPEDSHLLSERGPVGTAQVVPAVPQLRCRPAYQRGPFGKQPPQRRPQQGPAEEEQYPDIPAERGEHHAGKEPAEPVAERAGQRHRRVRGPGGGQLAASGRQLIEDRRVLQVLYPRRRAYRPRQPPLHPGGHHRRAVR
jgi:hypothetical protein